MNDPSLMSQDELQTEFVSLANQLVAVENRRAALLNEMDRRTVQASAKTRLMALSDVEKDALRDQLGPKVDAKITEEGGIAVVKL